MTCSFFSVWSVFIDSNAMFIGRLSMSNPLRTKDEIEVLERDYWFE